MDRRHQLFGFSNQFAGCTAQGGCQLEQRSYGGLVLTSFNQGNEVPLHTGFQTKMLLTPIGRPSTGAQSQAECGGRSERRSSQHIGKLSMQALYFVIPTYRELHTSCGATKEPLDPIAFLRLGAGANRPRVFRGNSLCDMLFANLF